MKKNENPMNHVLTRVFVIATLLSMLWPVSLMGNQACVDVIREQVKRENFEKVSSLRQLVYGGLKKALSARYNVKVSGLNEVFQRGNKKIIFMFEHPALIDPVILGSEIGALFNRPRPVIAESQNTGVKKLVFKLLDPFFVPDVSKHSDPAKARARIEKNNRELLEAVAAGANAMVAPSGQIKRTHLEEIRGRRMAAEFIQKLPEGARVVLVTSKGLFGSSFSYGATGEAPTGPRITGDLIANLATGKLQKRNVDLGFHEISPAELKRLKTQEVQEINAFLESKMNESPVENIYVPLVGCRPVCQLPNPVPKNQVSAKQQKGFDVVAEKLPPELKSRVVEILRENSVDPKSITVEKLTEKKDETLTELLGLDSLAMTELLMKVEMKFDLPSTTFLEVPRSFTELLTSIYKGQNGMVDVNASKGSRRVDLRWFRYHRGKEFLEIPKGGNLLELVFKKAKENPDAPWMSDGKAGFMTYREGISKIMVLTREIKKMKGKNLGIMLPPGVGTTLFFFATLNAGKVPTMMNYTAGNRNLEYSANQVGVKTVVTSREFVEALEKKDLRVDILSDRFTYTEDLIASMSNKSLGNAWNLAMNLIHRERGRFKSLWPRVSNKDSNETVAILFTSGSSSWPKPVAWTHKNVITNIRDLKPIFDLQKRDSLAALAPVFHSLGLTGTLFMPAITGMRVSYSPDATDGLSIVNSIATHKNSMIIAPPGLMRQIFAKSTKEDLESLKFVITGAEPLTRDTAKFLQEKAENAIVLEAAGATETSPVWALNPPGDVRLGFVGKLLPSLKSEIVESETLDLAISKNNMSLIEVVPGKGERERTGELVLSGDSVITSYYGNVNPNAFFQWRGRVYYRTGDKVMINPDGYVKILGRYSRQHKAPGGEMVSHQALEENLLRMPRLQPGEDGKPTLYIGAGKASEEAPMQTVLVTTKEISLKEVNEHLGKTLSATFFVGKIIKVDELPSLGGVKVDGRTINEDIIKLAP